MSRPQKGARLWCRPERRDPTTGRLKERSRWFIRDGKEFIATGCLPEEIAKAEQCLAAYIAARSAKPRRTRDIEAIDVCDVLDFYVTKTREGQANKPKLDERIKRLKAWWEGKTLADITDETCEAYTKHRKTPGGARRDLQDLQAAVTLHHKSGRHREVVKLLLPERGSPRDRWLTRSELARLLWVCWRKREVQKWKTGKRAGQEVVTDKRPLRHIARFILIGYYTGTRAGAIATASPIRAEGRSYVDLETGVFHRLADGKKATKKRQPPVRLPARLLAHMRRWRIKTHFIEWNGKPVQSVKTGFRTAVKEAGLEGKVHPHTLRHTSATWMMQNGVDVAEIAGYLGMTVKMLNDVYGHHHPDFQHGVGDSFSVQHRRARQKVGISAGAPTKRNAPRGGSV